MPIGNYTNLFGTLGSIVQAIYRTQHLSSGLTTPLNETATWNFYRNFITGTGGHANIIGETYNRWEVLEGLETWTTQIQERMSVIAREQAQWADLAINSSQSPATLGLDGLPQNPSIQDYMLELIRDMNEQSETVLKNVATIPATGTASGTNNGTGVMLVTSYLDGVTPPSPGLIAHSLYNDVLSQMPTTLETVVATCTRDQPSNGLPEGEEVFRVEGEANIGKFTWDNTRDGSAASLNVSSLKSFQLITNKDFESWTADAPTGWTVNSGTAGTHIVEETTAGQVYIGDRALRITGDGAQATINLTVPIGSGVFTPGKMYRLSCYVKGEAGIVAGALTIKFTGTGYDGGSSQTGGVNEQVSMNAAALAAQTSYGEEGFWIIMPDIIPDDLVLEIEVTGTLTSGGDIRIANIMCGPAAYVDGAGIAIVPGSTQFLKEDRFTLTMLNDNAGIFQSFFREQWGVQLPSATSGGETIAESLAEPLVGL